MPGCNGISERLMTVKRAQTHPHKTDYPSVTEAAERGWVERWREGGGGEALSPHAELLQQGWG